MDRFEIKAFIFIINEITIYLAILLKSFKGCLKAENNFKIKVEN